MKFIKKNNLENDFHLQLEKLIHLMKNTGFLNDSNIEKAFKKAPRHNFVPDSKKILLMKILLFLLWKDKQYLNLL